MKQTVIFHQPKTAAWSKQKEKKEKKKQQKDLKNRKRRRENNDDDDDDNGCDDDLDDLAKDIRLMKKLKKGKVLSKKSFFALSLPYAFTTRAVSSICVADWGGGGAERQHILVIGVKARRPDGGGGG
jgi:hypothetical protein